MTNAQLFRALALAALLCSAGASAWACRCVEPRPGAAYRDATAVASVEVIEVRGDAEGPGGAVVRMNVVQSWKSALPAQIEVSTRTTCAYPFEHGQAYLVYLRPDTGAAPFLTQRCMGNRPAAEATVALKWLSWHGKTLPASAPVR